MYTMVLMMAASSAGDTADFGFRKGGCTGTVVAAPACCPTVPAGCTGPVVAAPACCPTVPAGCTGVPAGCTGRTGILGGFLKNHKLFGGRSSGCTGGAGCTGAIICAPITTGCGCTGGTIAAPVGCYSTIGTVGTPVTMPPVTMPPVTPKKDEPKKDEPKKGSES